jgi:hypothetical protein
MMEFKANMRGESSERMRLISALVHHLGTFLTSHRLGEIGPGDMRHVQRSKEIIAEVHAPSNGKLEDSLNKLNGLLGSINASDDMNDQLHGKIFDLLEELEKAQ